MVPKQIEGAEVFDKVGAKLPKDVELIDHNGKKIHLGDRFVQNNKGLPMIWTLGYFECPMLCSLVLNGLIESLKGMSLQLGRDYTIGSVSINPEDTVKTAFFKRGNYLKALDVADKNAPWDFYVAQAEQSKKLADAVGFGYKKDPRSKDIAHGAAIFIVSPDGTLTRTLWGISFKPSELKLALLEAADGKVGTTLDRILLSCFHYDPDSHKYGLYIFGVMRIGGAVTVLVLALMLAFYWRSEKKRVVYNE